MNKFDLVKPVNSLMTTRGAAFASTARFGGAHWVGAEGMFSVNSNKANKFNLTETERTWRGKYNWYLIGNSRAMNKEYRPKAGKLEIALKYAFLALVAASVISNF